MLTNMYLRESIGKSCGVWRTKPCMSTAGYDGEDSEVHVRYARGRRGQPYPASRDATAPFFFLAY